MNVSNIRQPTQLISDGDRLIYETINYVSLTGVISLFGVVSNFMNIVVFYKQGFHNTMNISFFGLAIADLCGLVTLIWGSICQNPLFINSNVPWSTPEIQYLAAGAPHICFGRITGWITVFVTAERCLCISLPLKIKQVITPRRTKLIVCIIYVVFIVIFFPTYTFNYFGWKFYPKRNRTLIGLIAMDGNDVVESVVLTLYSVLGSISFVAVIVFTLLLVIQLKQKSKWRKTAQTGGTRSESITSRDRKTLNMVVMIATVLIVCYTPGVAVSLVTIFEPEISVSGTETNCFYVLWAFVLTFEAINSSVNIFLYYNMSSKYRETFRQVFCTWNSVRDTSSHLSQ